MATPRTYDEPATSATDRPAERNGSTNSSPTVLPSGLLRGFRRVSDAPLTTPLQAVAFWTAIALPWVHVPMLATGLGTTAELRLFGLLIVANLLALVVGYHHNR